MRAAEAVRQARPLRELPTHKEPSDVCRGSIGSLFSFEAFYDFSTNVLHLFKLQLLFGKSVVSSLALHTHKTQSLAPRS